MNMKKNVETGYYQGYGKIFDMKLKMKYIGVRRKLELLIKKLKMLRKR